MNHPLIQHPPRLSDLHGDDRRKALFARGAAARDRWLATRRPRGFVAWVRQKVAG